MSEFNGWVGIPGYEYLYLLIRGGLTLDSMDSLMADLENVINRSPDFWGDFWNEMNGMGA